MATRCFKGETEFAGSEDWKSTVPRLPKWIRFAEVFAWSKRQGERGRVFVGVSRSIEESLLSSAMIFYG